MRKKGQVKNAAAAATLVGLIAALIVLYILVIPPEDRQRILDDDSGSSSYGSSDDYNITLFELEESKTFMSLDTKEFEKDIPSVTIYVAEEGTMLKKSESLYAKKSLFSEKTASVNFEITDLDDTKNVLLNFLVKDKKGRLNIGLNGYEIYNSEITTSNVAPIKLEEFLSEGLNTLEFSVSSPGAAFWSTNRYEIEDLTITADLVNRDAQESKNSFMLASDERANLEKVRLRFIPECEEELVGKLDVWINNYNLYSAVPDCTSATILDFSPSKLVIGENVLNFETQKGKYLINQIKLTSDLKEVELPVYYFQITEKQYTKIDNAEVNVTLSIVFVDDTEEKEADIIINGDLIRLDQEERKYSEKINKYLEEGNNAIKIDPEDTLEVVELKITYYDEDYDEDGDCEPNRYRRKCYQGDVWWYDACNSRYKISEECSSNEYCDDGRCIRD